MSNQPLLSVIVPCYNVERYIDKCVASIVGQTYHNLEILLIDDGSTDKTGEICDVWQGKDPRIKVIHQQNEGSSYTRKKGVENATAEYITFVDADDWIDEKMYTKMMAALLSTRSDIAQCGIFYMNEESMLTHCSSEYKKGSFEIVDRTKGVLLVVCDEWNSYMWNKIYKKHLFDHIEFPKGRGLSEDTSIMHVLFHHAVQTVCLQDEFYYYVRRYGSITNPKNIASKMKNSYDTYNSFYERYCFVEQYPEYYSCLNNIKNRVLSCGLRVLRYSIIHPQYFPEHFSISVKKQLKVMDIRFRNIAFHKYSLFEKIELLLFLHFSFYHKLYVKTAMKIKSLFMNKSNDCSK